MLSKKVLQPQEEEDQKSCAEGGAVERRQRGEEDRGGGLGGGATVNGWWLGKIQKEGQRSDRAEEHQKVVEKGEEDEVQARESEQHSGRACEESPWRN